MKNILFSIKIESLLFDKAFSHPVLVVKQCYFWAFTTK